MKADYINFSVIVNGGSGCAFKIHHRDYMYVLTAKHVVENQQTTVRRQFLDVNGAPQEEILKIIDQPYLHIDANKDAAIIKVEVVPEIKSVARLEKPLEINDDLFVAGFPNSRSKQPYAYRKDSLNSKNIKAYEYVECQLKTPSTYGEIVGLSGGGIYYSTNGENYLVGIQSKMSAEDDDELLNNIDIMPLKFFDEIIKESKVLEPLIPEYLQCFSTLKSYALKLEGCFGSHQMEFTKQLLQEVTDEVVSNNLTPTIIRNFFESKLLVFEQADSVLGTRGLWIAWLEFLIIFKFIKDEQIDDKNIESLFNEVRLIYSDTNGDWTDEFPKLFRSNFYGLPQDAKVIVATQTRPEKVIISNNVIPNIIQANPLTKGQMQIDIGLTHPLVNFKLMHLHAFQRLGIIEKEQEYYGFSAINENDLLDKLKTEFNALFS